MFISIIIASCGRAWQNLATSLIILMLSLALAAATAMPVLAAANNDKDILKAALKNGNYL